MVLLYPRIDPQMTVAIVGFPSSSDYIVTVSDARISHGEMIPAADEAAMKNRKIASNWGMMFAATDASAFIPVLSSVYASLSFVGGDAGPIVSEIEAKKAVQAAYEKELSERFFREHLARFGYGSITEFRQSGFTEMGKDLYHHYAKELARFDLGLELLVYGFDEGGKRHLFEVANPGKIISHNLRGFAAIGSGALMALAAFNRRPISSGLPETIYRLLDAKFSSETAPEVGKKTHVFLMNNKRKFSVMSSDEVAKIRAIWDEEMKRSEREDVMDILRNTHAVKTICS